MFFLLKKHDDDMTLNNIEHMNHINEYILLLYDSIFMVANINTKKIHNIHPTIIHFIFVSGVHHFCF